MGFNLAGFFGLNAPKSQYRQNQAGALTNLEATRPAYQAIRNRGTGMVNQFAPQQTQAAQELVNYYKAGPDAAGLNASNALALRGASNGYAAAQARLKALGARTGADTTGATIALQSKQAASAFPMLEQIAARKQAETERFKRGYLGVTGQLTGEGANTERYGLQGGQALEGQIYGQAGNLAAADEAQKAATFNRIMSFVQGAGQIAGGAGGGGAAAASRAVPQAGGGGAIYPEGYIPESDYLNPADAPNYFSEMPASSPATSRRRRFMGVF